MSPSGRGAGHAAHHCSEVKELIVDLGHRVEELSERGVRGEADYGDENELPPPRGVLRRLAVPLKKTSRRLRELEESLGGRLDSALEIQEVAARDVDRKFGDFFNMTMEMFEHQHQQVILYYQHNYVSYFQPFLIGKIVFV